MEEHWASFSWLVCWTIFFLSRIGDISRYCGFDTWLGWFSEVSVAFESVVTSRRCFRMRLVAAYECITMVIWKCNNILVHQSRNAQVGFYRSVVNVCKLNTYTGHSFYVVFLYNNNNNNNILRTNYMNWFTLMYLLYISVGSAALHEYSQTGAGTKKP